MTAQVLPVLRRRSIDPSQLIPTTRLIDIKVNWRKLAQVRFVTVNCKGDVMAGYKSLLVVLTNKDHAKSTILAAAPFALAMDAHLHVLVLGVDRNQLGYSYIGAGAVLLQAATDQAEANAKACVQAVEEALRETAAGLRSSVEAAVCQLGSVVDIVTSRARYADLVIQPRPYGPNAGPEEEAIVEAALFEAQAPVMVLPALALPLATPKRIVLAWNQSREALAATHRALPLLQLAQSVAITVVDPPLHGAERSDPGGALCQFLARHGVRAEVSVLAGSLFRVSDVLARQVRDQNADLLVMGAYGHSRLREAILGGATRNMLEKSEVPVFLAH